MSVCAISNCLETATFWIDHEGRGVIKVCDSHAAFIVGEGIAEVIEVA